MSSQHLIFHVHVLIPCATHSESMRKASALYLEITVHTCTFMILLFYIADWKS